MGRTCIFLLVPALAALTASCGDDPAPAPGCVTGQTIACACAGGVSGVQACQSDHSYGACVCAGGDAATDAPSADAPAADATPTDGAAPDASPTDGNSVDATSTDVADGSAADAVDVPALDVADGSAADASDVPALDVADGSAADAVDVPARDIADGSTVDTVDAPALDAPGADLPSIDAPTADLPSTDAPADAPPSCPAVTIGSTGGTVSCAGVTLTVPAGALTTPVPLQVTVSASSVPTGYAGYSPVYRFEPAGTTFAVPARVTVPFTGNAARATLFWSRATGGGYERLGGLASGGALGASVTHFSAGFVGDGVDYREPADRSCTVTRLLEGRTVSPSGIAMFFTAEDCLGRPLTDLAASDFVVREDGTALSSEASATLISRVGPQVFASLVLDLSASTRAFLPQLIAAAQRFVTTLQTDRRLPVQISVQVFAGESGLTEWQAPTLDTARLLSRLDALSGYTAPDPGSTNLYGATITALSRQAAAESAFRARNAGGAFTTGYVVLFTDGGDTAGLRTQSEAADAVRASADRTLAVGLAGGDFMPAVLTALAPAGALISPDAATLTREFDALASRIAAEFRTLYLLGYCSARRAGAHTVTVSVAGGTTMPAASYGFSAAAFGGGCSAATFTDACAAADQCGGLGCGACDDRASLCDGASRRCVDHCVTARQCGGASFTNPLGYAQTCPDRPDATLCAGACRDLRTDLSHCGACGNACTGGSPCVAGVCLALPPRQLAPLSTSTVTSQQPTMRWVAGGSTDGTRVELCRDRAMTAGCITPIDATGTSGRPPAPLAAGVWFWRLSGRRGGATVTTTTPVWQFVVGARSAPRDLSWGTTLDVNGDGYADIATVGSSSGLVYLGGPSGPATTPISRAESLVSGVMSAGDVNGDGFGDLLVDSSATSTLSIYLGGSTGPATTSQRRMPPVGFGPGIGPAGVVGDVNGDGYADITKGQYLYLGSATGLAATPTTLPLPPGLMLVPTPIGVGDVNGDGYEDAATTALSTAPVYFYRGGPTGLGSPTAIMAPSGLGSSGSFGGTIAFGGDVNGDGLADFLISGPGPSFGMGTALLYLGTTSGPTSTPLALSGYGVAFGGRATIAGAGDLNGDGFSDVALSSEATSAVTLHFGAATGVSTTPRMLSEPSGSSGFGLPILGVGDVNGDGIGDLVVGASGRIYYFSGSATGPASAPTVTLTPP